MRRIAKIKQHLKNCRENERDFFVRCIVTSECLSCLLLFDPRFVVVYYIAQYLLYPVACYNKQQHYFKSIASHSHNSTQFRFADGFDLLTVMHIYNQWVCVCVFVLSLMCFIYKNIYISSVSWHGLHFIRSFCCIFQHNS